MAAELIDGKAISAEITAETAVEAAKLIKEHNLKPGLAVVLVGEDPASQFYVNAKEKKANELGFKSEKVVLPIDATQEDVLAVVRRLNEDPSIHGILVQSPPPPQINEGEIILNINPDKDVDGFHPYNVGKVLIGEGGGFAPCTPHGCQILLERSGVDLTGKHVVIIGRSNIVGKPMASLLMQKAPNANATVTVVHSRTPDIAHFTRQADVIVAAIGKPGFVTGDMVKEGAVVIDVGINRVEDATRPRGYRIVGDCLHEDMLAKTSKFTPVPGGVGPMTIAMLMHNTVVACKNLHNIQD